MYLDTQAGLRKGETSGPAIVPGRPEASLLIKAVRYDDKDRRMPPAGKPAPAEIADLVLWINDPRDDKLARGGA